MPSHNFYRFFRQEMPVLVDSLKEKCLKIEKTIYVLLKDYDDDHLIFCEIGCW